MFILCSGHFHPFIHELVCPYSINFHAVTFVLQIQNLFNKLHPWFHLSLSGSDIAAGLIQISSDLKWASPANERDHSGARFADRRPYRGALHDVPPHGFVPAALAEVQQVVHHHLSDQVVSGEAVEVVDGEVKLPGM